MKTISLMTIVLKVLVMGLVTILSSVALGSTLTIVGVL